ncbi:alkyl/aryl-sulfatase [Amycolatopsis jejuensis]|uniref:alkyl/aryl-sulfatase n=1 Tax=Amycolatopsis jejuensis TaxID=330084 RepID=UPI00052515B9|nr:alkyl sulfatase dimerization domain-containing protein [Amycolatopsis jejuensis]
MPAEPNWADRTDFENAGRGLIDRLEPCVIRNAEGRVVWDNERWGFLDHEPCPATVNPSLWRQGRLNAVQGLFEVTPGIYQIRGLDCANMTVIEGATGVIVVDPLICTEVAAAAFELYRRNRGDRPVRAVVYSHSHGDHYGGVLALTSAAEVEAGECQIIAPEGFTGHAVSESIIAGPTMRVRGTYQYGSLLPAGPEGCVGGGLAQSWSSGTKGLIAPTVDIVETGQQLVVDGVPMVFQLTPETEAPAEMNFHLPGHQVLLVAENANHTLHNLLTLRGALVRDAKAWAGYLTETIQLFCDDAEILIGSHNWPTWGRAELTAFLEQQRDGYAYLHDQTVRLMNRGMTGIEIAEELRSFPGELGRAWHLRGYYGTISHNVKAIYQRYMGWYDGNPAHLWQLPPAEAGERYVSFMGGADAVVQRARESFEAGDYRWVAEVLNHVLFSQPEHREARELQAQTFERLAWAQESGTWRNCYLTAAHELRGTGPFAPERRTRKRGASLMSPSMLDALSAEHLFAMLAVRFDGPRGADLDLTVRWELDGPRETWTTRVKNGVFTPIRGSMVPPREPDAVVTLSKAALCRILATAGRFGDELERGTLTVTGTREVLAVLDELFEAPAREFPLASPRG